MRTTIELPADLMRAAKALAARSGETMKALFTRAISAEVGRRSRATSVQHVPVGLPVFGDPAGPRVSLSNKDIARLVAAEDADAVRAGSRRRR